MILVLYFFLLFFFFLKKYSVLQVGLDLSPVLTECGRNVTLSVCVYLYPSAQRRGVQLLACWGWSSALWGHLGIHTGVGQTTRGGWLGRRMRKTAAFSTFNTVWILLLGSFHLGKHSYVVHREGQNDSCLSTACCSCNFQGFILLGQWQQSLSAVNVLWSLFTKSINSKTLTVLVDWFSSFGFPRQQSPTWSLEVSGAFLPCQIVRSSPGHNATESQEQINCWKAVWDRTGTVPAQFKTKSWVNSNTKDVYFSVYLETAVELTQTEVLPSLHQLSWGGLLPLGRVKVEKSDCWRLNPDTTLG